MMLKSHGISMEKIEEIILQIKALGLKYYTISGGEPFLHPSIHQILLSSFSHGLYPTIISNGTCFEKNNIPILIKYNPTLQLSFDGHNSMTHDATRGKGNFERLLSGYQRSLSLGYLGKIILRVNLHKNNIIFLSDILEMLDREYCLSEDLEQRFSVVLAYLHRSTPDEIGFDYYIEPENYGNQPELSSLVKGWNMSHTQKITDISAEPDIGCPFYGKDGTINCGIRIAINGNVYPCQLFSDDKYCIGNIYQSDLKQIVNGDMMNSFLYDVQNRQKRIGDCLSCAYMGVCRGGCPGQAVLQKNTLFAVSPRCEERKQKLGTLLFNYYEERRSQSSRQE